MYAARALPRYIGLTHEEPRTCVIKVCDYNVRLEDAVTGKNKDNCKETLKKLRQRIVMETYILNRQVPLMSPCVSTVTIGTNGFFFEFLFITSS